MKQATKTLVQCDFDGTVTEEDVSYLLLDAFAGENWRQLLKQYEEGEITVGHFNTQAFSMIKDDKGALLEYMNGRVKIRDGFQKLVAYCRRRGFRFTIVSNGLDFYIDNILGNIGMRDIEAFAARTCFTLEGLKVQYVGPDGNYLDSDFKEAHVNSFLGQGYRIIYMGNGDSDLLPARDCHYVFATGTLLDRCKQTNLDCTPFTDFHEVIRVLERL